MSRNISDFCDISLVLLVIGTINTLTRHRYFSCVKSITVPEKENKSPNKKNIETKILRAPFS